jgi:hypothetical protein
MVSVPVRPLFTPGERTLVLIVQEAGWASELVWTQSLKERGWIIFAPKMNEVTRGSEEVHNFYSSTNIFKMIKSKRMS